jgi:hypothetical protein
MLGLELFTFGGASVAKGVVKSSLKAEKSLMKLGGKALKSKGDDALKLVDNKIDDVGRSLIDDTAGGANGISSELTGVSQKYLGCFAAGTPIQTPSGSKPIEEFVPSDWVLAQDESDPDAVPTLRQVEEVFENQAQVMVMGLGGREIETTPEHPFWVRDKGWTAAGEIETGDELRSHDGQWIPLESKQLTDRIVTVYNMRVAEDHTYFVGSPLWGFTVWAHNACLVNNRKIAETQGLTHSFDSHATQWYAQHGVKLNINQWQSLIETASKSKKIFRWSTGVDKTVAHIARIDGNKWFHVQFYTSGLRSGELATAFIPNSKQTGAILRILGN